METIKEFLGTIISIKIKLYVSFLDRSTMACKLLPERFLIAPLKMKSENAPLKPIED